MQPERMLERTESYPITDYVSINITPAPSNCQLFFVDFLSISLRKDTDKTVAIIRNFAQRSYMPMCFVHVVKEKDIEILEDYFNLIYKERTPIGDSRGYQFHAIFEIEI